MATVSHKRLRERGSKDIYQSPMASSSPFSLAISSQSLDTFYKVRAAALLCMDSICAAMCSTTSFLVSLSLRGK